MKRDPDDKTTYALFDSPEEMERAFRELLACGISIEDISMLMTETTRDRVFDPLLKQTRAVDGAMAGGVFGGTLGGILGGLVALGVSGGVGLLVLGPALAFAATGGLVGGFLGHEIEEGETKRIHGALHEGKALMAVHTHRPHELQAARLILNREHAERFEAQTEAH